MRELPERLMPTPPYVDGIEPGELSAARRSGALALGFGLLSHDSSPLEAYQASQGAFQNSIQTAAQMRERAVERSEMERANVALQQIVEKLGPPPQNDPDGLNNYLLRMQAELVGAGLHRHAAAIQGSVRAPQAPKQKEKPRPIIRDMGGFVGIIDPETGKLAGRIPKTPPPKRAVPPGLREIDAGTDIFLVDAHTGELVKHFDKTAPPRAAAPGMPPAQRSPNNAMAAAQAEWNEAARRFQQMPQTPENRALYDQAVHRIGQKYGMIR